MTDFRVLVLICVVLGGMGQGIVAPKLPELLKGSSHLALDSGLSASLMYLGVFISTFRFGKMADQGRVHLLLAPGLLAYGLVLILLGLLPGEISNFVLRFFEGICLSAIFVSSDFVLGRLSKPSERGEWLSYYGVAISIGLLLGPALALAIGRISALPIASLSVASCVALALAIGTFQKRVPAATESKAAPSNLNFAALISGSAYGFMESGLVAVLPVMAIEAFHLKPEICLVVVIVSAAISSIGWGKVSDRYRPKPVVLVLVSLLASGPLLMAFSSSMISSSALLLGSCVLFGILAGGIYPIAFAWLLESVGESQYGYASGAFARAYGIGSLAGPLLAGAVVERWSMQGLLTLLSLVGVFAFVAILRSSPESRIETVASKMGY